MIDYQHTLHTISTGLKVHDDNIRPFLDNISSVFVPYFDPAFCNSKNRVVIVGQESRGWQKRLAELMVEQPDFSGMIQRSKQRHQALYEAAPGRSKFLQYLASIKQANHHEYVQWLNFYICDYKRRSFNNLNNKKSGHVALFEYMRDVSVNNLAQQLQALEPSVIFFVGAYHNNFPLLEQALGVHKEKLQLPQPVEKLSLTVWNDSTLVLRTPHPAVISTVAHKARMAALRYFELFDKAGSIEAFKAALLEKEIAF